VCEKCNVEVARINWVLHLKTKAHMKNDPDQTVNPTGRIKQRKI